MPRRLIVVRFALAWPRRPPVFSGRRWPVGRSAGQAKKHVNSILSDYGGATQIERDNLNFIHGNSPLLTGINPAAF